MASLQSRIQQSRDWWLDRLWADWLIAALLVVLHLGLVVFVPAADILGNAAPPDRRAVYSAAAIIVTLLASFSSVAIGQLSAARGPRADALRQNGAQELARNWRSIFQVGLLAALLALIALLLDPSAVVRSEAGTSEVVVPVVARWLFEAGLVVAVIKFLRSSALFSRVLMLAARSTAEGDDDQKRAPAPQPNPDWHRAVG